MTGPRLAMTGVGKRFGPTVALDGVNLTLQPGTVHALVGENGAGKSTLMKVLSGALEPDTGSMQLDGEAYAPTGPAAGRDAGVAMIYQELSLAPDLSVAENVMLGIEPAMGPLLRWGELRRRTAEALRRIGHDEIDPSARVGTLPIAQQQLVEIARSLVTGCRVLVLDEPTSSLGRQDIERLFELIRSLKEQGTAVVYISHFLEEVRAVADEVTVLRDGRTVGHGVMAELTTDRIVELMVGRNVDELYPRSVRTPGGVLLELDGLTGVDAPTGAKLSLHAGEVLGIAGLVGAGRTELLRAVFGLDPVRQGVVKVAGIQRPPRHDRSWRRGLGMVSEDRKVEGLATALPIATNLALARLRRFTSPGRERAESGQWIDKLGIRCRSAGQPVSDLSGGNQQKVAIARLLHAGADVMLLDEPTRGIDVGSKATIYQLIDELACAGKAVLIVSSYLEELLGVCDRIAVMHRGRLGEARPIEQCTAHQLMLEATGAGAGAEGSDG